MKKNKKTTRPDWKLNKSMIAPAMTVYHVGSRGNYVPVSYPAHFDHDIEFVLFEAGDEEAGHSVVLSDGRTSSSAFTNIKELVWSKDESVEFFERRCPYTSGVLKFNNKYKDWYFFGNGNCDYLLGQAHETVQTLRKNSTTLDEVARKFGNKNNPALLCIDAQGASLQILQGSKTLLKERIMGVICEVEFEPFYQNSALFGDVHKYLLSKGFHFVRLIPENGWGLPFRAPVGLRSGTLTSSADAIFIRTPSDIGKTGCPSIASAYVLLCHLWSIVDLVGPALPFIRRRGCGSPVNDFASDVALLWGEISKLSKFRARDFDSLKRQIGAQGGVSKQHMTNQILYYQNKISSKYEKLLLKYGFEELSCNIQKIRGTQEPYINYDESI